MLSKKLQHSIGSRKIKLGGYVLTLLTPEKSDEQKSHHQKKLGAKLKSGGYRPLLQRRTVPATTYSTLKCHSNIST